MKNTLKLLVVCFAIFGMALVTTGCKNEPAPAKAECTSDANCNASSKCRVCNSGKCTTLSDCCTADTQCKSGQRCWNVPGKSYGKCGNP